MKLYNFPSPPPCANRGFTEGENAVKLSHGSEMNRNLIIGLDCLLGRRLLRAQKLVRTNAEPTNPLEIGLVFEDEFYGSFHCEADGSIGFLGDSISPLLMGDYGDYIVEDIFGDDALFQVMGVELTTVFLIASEVEEVLVGVKFVFGKFGLNILNIGGKLQIYNRIPQSIRFEGKYRLISLR